MGERFGLGKRVSTKKLGLLDDILYSDREDPQAQIVVALSAVDRQLRSVSFSVSDFENDRFDGLESRLSGVDFATVVRASKLERKTLGDRGFYKTKDNLSVFYRIVQAGGSGDGHLLCLGYGEYQPMRYLVTLESLFELEPQP